MADRMARRPFLGQVGGGGRGKVPDRGHYQREIKTAFIAAHAGIDHLPPGGHDGNPIELCFGDYKNNWQHTWYPGGEPRFIDGIESPGPRTFEEIEVCVSDWVRARNAEAAVADAAVPPAGELPKGTHRLAGYVRERATWRSLGKNKTSTRWLKVVAEREAAENPLTYSPLTAYNARYARPRERELADPMTADADAYDADGRRRNEERRNKRARQEEAAAVGRAAADAHLGVKRRVCGWCRGTETSVPHARSDRCPRKERGEAQLPRRRDPVREPRAPSAPDAANGAAAGGAADSDDSDSDSSDSGLSGLHGGVSAPDEEERERSRRLAAAWRDRQSSDEDSDGEGGEGEDGSDGEGDKGEDGSAARAASGAAAALLGMFGLQWGGHD